MADSASADSNIFLLRSDNPKYIASIYGTLPGIDSPFREMDIYQFEVLDEVLTDEIWENARHAVRSPTHDKDEVDEFRKNDRELEKLFIRAPFEAEY
jgi:hypothetical protein